MKGGDISFFFNTRLYLKMFKKFYLSMFLSNKSLLIKSFLSCLISNMKIFKYKIARIVFLVKFSLKY